MHNQTFLTFTKYYSLLTISSLFINSVFQSVIPEVLNRESSVFKRFWIPRSSPMRISARSRSDRRITKHEFMDRLCLAFGSFPPLWPIKKIPFLFFPVNTYFIH